MNAAPAAASLYETFATVPDPREPLRPVLHPGLAADALGRRHALRLPQPVRPSPSGAAITTTSPPCSGFSRPAKGRDGYRTPCVSELHTVLAALTRPRCSRPS